MKFLVMFLLALALVGCGSSPASKLVGTWRADIGGREGIGTYRADGTFTKKTGAGLARLELQGTYQISGNSLTETITKVFVGGREATTPNMSDLIGKTLPGEFKFLDDDTVETTSAGETVKMVRIKS